MQKPFLLLSPDERRTFVETRRMRRAMSVRGKHRTASPTIASLSKAWNVPIEQLKAIVLATPTKEGENK